MLIPEVVQLVVKSPERNTRRHEHAGAPAAAATHENAPAAALKSMAGRTERCGEIIHFIGGRLL